MVYNSCIPYEFQRSGLPQLILVCVCVCARAGVCACARVCVCMLRCTQLFATPWTIACQTPLYMVFSRQEYWSGLPFPAPGDLPDPGSKPASLASPTLQQTLYHCTIWEAFSYFLDYTKYKSK